MQRMPHCSAASMTLARIRSPLTLETWGKRRKDVREMARPPLRRGLGHDFEGVGPFAPRDRSLPLAIASIENQNGFACGEPQHVAEIVALVAFECDRRRRC